MILFTLTSMTSASSYQKHSNHVKMINFHNAALGFAFIITLSLLDVVHCTSAKPNIDANTLTKNIGANRTIVVDVNEKGDFKSIQAAVDSVPKGNANWIIIHIRKGVYREKVQIPKDKPYIFMRGNGRAKTAIVWSQSSADNYESSTFKVEAPHFIAFGISFKNDAPTGIAHTSNNQSVAIFVSADMVAFYQCGFFSTHNTIFDNKGRHYYDDCYIQGSIDIIFGRGQTIFNSCEIFVIEDGRVEIRGSVAAQSRLKAKGNSGFIFNGGRIYGVGDVYLGRAQGDYSRVVFANTYMSKTIVPEGWTNWNNHGSSSTQNLYQAEYNCHGPGADQKKRAPWSKQLNEKEAAPFLSVDFINGKQWLPA